MSAAPAPVTSNEKLWLPLESNPALMNKYLASLGATGDNQFHDVFGVEEELLEMVPKPVIAVLLLFPISPASEAFDQEQADKIKAAGGTPGADKLYFMKQTVGNACGTIGLIHTVMNLRQHFRIEEGKFFHKFISDTLDASPETRAEALERNNEIEVQHQEVAADPEAKSNVDDITNVNLHFIAFLEKDGQLWELDGRKDGPICHGPTNADTLLADSVRVIKQFMERDPEEIRFNMVALAPKGAEDS